MYEMFISHMIPDSWKEHLYCKLICKRKRKPLYGLVGKKMFWSIGHFRLDFQKLSCSKQDQVQNLLIEFFNNINQKKTELS